MDMKEKYSRINILFTYRLTVLNYVVDAKMEYKHLAVIRSGCSVDTYTNLNFEAEVEAAQCFAYLIRHYLTKLPTCTLTR